MIPVDPKSTVMYTDPDSGVVYEFRYLLKERQDEFLKFSIDAEKAVKPFMAQAKKEIEAELKGEKLKKGELEKRVRIRAGELAESASDKDSGYTKSVAKMIDIFLAGWSHPDPELKLPKFPDKPSECFRFIDLQKMGKVVNDLMPELIGFEVEEVKN